MCRNGTHAPDRNRPGEKMDQTRTDVVATGKAEPQNNDRLLPASQFLSQLIAERDRLPPQRLKRRATVATALGAYREGTGRAVPRVPKGFFRTLSA